MDWILNKLLNIQNFLEFYIVNGITWKYNINQMSSKIAKMTGIIGKARYYIPRKCLLPLYTMVYPYLSYCKITWTCTYPTRLQSIFITQKKVGKNYDIFKLQGIKQTPFYFIRNQQIFCCSFRVFIL